jgi:hypothetical protein
MMDSIGRRWFNMKLLLITILLSGCAHRELKCGNGKTREALRQQEIVVHAALLASPDYLNDLNRIKESVGEEDAVCLVKASREGFMQIANKDPDLNPMIKPHLAVGVQRADEWLGANTLLTRKQGNAK